MPFLSKTNFKHFKLFLWKIDETESDLENDIFITSSLQEKLDKMKSAQHRKGILSVRHLMKLANILESDLYYDSFGAPNLKSKRFISISHSKYFSGIALSFIPIGLDIEACRKKIIRIAPKFIHNQELDAMGDIEKLTYIWTSKEALYKAFRTPGINYSNQLNIIHPFEFKKKGQGIIYYQNKFFIYELSSTKIDNHYVTIAYKKTD